MPSGSNLPTSFQILLNRFRLGFTGPSFTTFCSLLRGFICHVGEHNVCGMLTGAGLAQVWHHGRAHRFFSHRRWSIEALGLQLAGLVLERLLPDDAPMTIAVDSTLFRRWGPKVYGAHWAHDGAAATPHSVAFGNTWVVVGIVIPVPLCRRSVCFPVLFRLWHAGSKVTIARELVCQLSERFPQRQLDVVGDAEFISRDLRNLPPRITWTSRPRANAVFHDLAPAPTGRPGRPRSHGDRLPSLRGLAASLDWSRHTVTRYGTTETVPIAHRKVIWYHAFCTQVMRLVMVRAAHQRDGDFEAAIITTDLTSSVDEIVERYASRWSIEVAFEEAKQVTGIGDARNRLRGAVLRTVPFGFIGQGLLTLWYITDLHDDADVRQRRRRAPWYRTKRTPSTFDMVVAARRVLLAADISGGRATPPTPAEIADVTRAWRLAAA